jgi:hypothetical protein
MGGGGYFPSGAGMLGVHIRKDMDDLRELEGVVAAYNTLTGYYKIAYRDGSTEELTQYQVNATAIVKDAPDDEIMWFHDDGQYGLLVGGKAPTA